jgi:hypothetical protein
MMRLLMTGALAAAALSGQTKVSVAPPRDIDRAARKIEQSWKAWQAARPEQRLLDRSAADGLAAIEQSQSLANRYIEAKRAYYSLVASSFQAHAAALLQEADEDPGKAAALREQQLQRLLEQQSHLRGRLEALEKTDGDERTRRVGRWRRWWRPAKRQPRMRQRGGARPKHWRMWPRRWWG